VERSQTCQPNSNDPVNRALIGFHGLSGNHLNLNRLIMNYYKIQYPNGSYTIAKATTMLELIKRYDLATEEHINTRIIQLEGEQLAIARSNENYY